MIDLYNQHIEIRDEIDSAIKSVIYSYQFIGGDIVNRFEYNLAKYNDVKHVISCGNGTDALQIALMSLDLKIGDEVIIPSFTYAATAEAVALLGLTPVFADVFINTFNINTDILERYITPKTKAIIPVHLFGQCSNMSIIMDIAKKYNLKVIEDTAQSLGATYNIDGITKKAGTIGDIGCTSFFPSKNLGCFGDGGAILTNNDELAKKIRMIANHGQKSKYDHRIIGCNSRLDTIQAAVLDIKLKHLDEWNKQRYLMANYYDKNLENVAIPSKSNKSTHTYNQYTIVLKNRGKLKRGLNKLGISTTIYYPIPLHKQVAFKRFGGECVVSEYLSNNVLSLPIYPTLSLDRQKYICKSINELLNG